MKNSRSITFFNSLRGTNLTKTDIYELLKEFTPGLDYTYLNHLQEDLKLYLIEQNKNIVDNLSEDEINAEINKRKLEDRPTLIIGALSGIISTNEEKIKEKKKIKYENRIDIESLMFPEEFSSLYILRNILKETLKQKELEQSNRINNPSVDLIDLSNSSGTEKIIMLHKLGVINFLKKKEPFNFSTNALASALSGITGIESKTVQSYINPINNPNVIQKNNPLKSDKAVNKVNQRLISLGYNATD